VAGRGGGRDDGRIELHVHGACLWRQLHAGGGGIRRGRQRLAAAAADELDRGLPCQRRFGYGDDVSVCDELSGGDDYLNDDDHGVSVDGDAVGGFVGGCECVGGVVGGGVAVALCDRVCVRPGARLRLAERRLPGGRLR
jgi:hypothetical protein